jgi:hypothetical protein
MTEHLTDALCTPVPSGLKSLSMTHRAEAGITVADRMRSERGMSTTISTMHWIENAFPNLMALENSLSYFNSWSFWVANWAISVAGFSFCICS